MAIITDPDNLDRFQVLVDYENEFISIRPVDTARPQVAPEPSGSGIGGSSFQDATQAFQSSGVASGMILTVVEGPNMNHWIITGVPSETQVDVETSVLGTMIDYTGQYAIYPATGGSVTDGGTLQAIYSFLKEEWKTPSSSGAAGALTDLIQFIFPLESITREQFEIGGPTHSNWDWKDDTTRNLIRTAGWNQVSGDGQILAKYAGIVTLGSLDSDTQVYYQQIDSASGTPTDPRNFVLLGAVNQAILFDDATPGLNTIGNQDGYLKLFARKKGKSYPTSEIADIGVSQLENIVNRFPLAHIDDPAIVQTDGALAGTGVWQNTDVVFGANNGSTSSQAGSQQEQTFTFTVGGGDLTASGIGPRDTLATGTTVGATTDALFEIISIDSATTMTVLQEPGVAIPTLGSIDYNIRTRIRNTGQADGSAFDDGGDSSTGTFISTNSDFSTTSVAANDILGILDGDNSLVGTYKVISVPNATGLKINTSDQNFPTSPATALTFEVYKPGMFLQYKEVDATDIPAKANTTFPNANSIQSPDINFTSSGYIVGGVALLGSSANTDNDGSYLITGIVTTTNTNDTLQLDTTLTTTTDPDTTVQISGTNGFLRSPQNTTFSYNWRLFGNGGSLAECFQWIQKQLRRRADTVLNDTTFHPIADIDTSSGVFRGDVTDLLMNFTSPNGTTLNMFIDDLANDDRNFATFEDVLGVGRGFAFLVSVTLALNSNILDDQSAKVVAFFTNDDSGDNTGRDYDTENAIIIQDSDGIEQSFVNPSANISFSYDYDNNVQRGTASAATTVPITAVAIGTSGAQWVRTDDSFGRIDTKTVSLVANLERNYSNPS